MQHSIQSEGFGVRLRPVRLADAEFIVWLRHLDHAKGRVGDSAADAVAQRAWLNAYFERPGDYYFIVETLGGIAVGAYGLYDLSGRSAESGRWIIRPGVPAAIPSAMVAFDVAFGVLGLSELRAKTVTTNQAVLSLNRKFGFRQTRIEAASQSIGGRLVDQAHFLLEGKDWPAVRERLAPLARLAETQVREWEKEQRPPGSWEAPTISKRASGP
jgi:RimJ/RimL family protein N-acetyltransferase